MYSPIFMPEEDRQLVFNTVDRLPPEDVIEQFKSKDQLIFWYRDKVQYQVLFDELKAYFAGREVQLWDDLSDREQKLYRAKRNYYLALYALLREAWREIKNFAEINSDVLLRVMDKTLDEKHRNNQELKDCFLEMFRQQTQLPPFEFPGQLLCTIIENDSRARFVRVLAGRYDMNFRKIYRLNLQFRKKMKEGASVDDLNKIARKIKKASGEFRPDMKEYEQPEKFCLAICWAASEKNVYIKKEYKKYQEATIELGKQICLSFKDQNSIAWEKGKRYGFRQEGGALVKDS
jgi:hypothetical protein